MPDLPVVQPGSTQPQIDRLLRGRTRIFALGLMGLDFLSFLAHQGWVRSWANPLEAACLGLSFLGLVGLVVGVDHLGPRRLLNGMAGLATLLAVLATLIHLERTPDVRETTHLMLVLVGAGCFLDSLPWLALNLGVALVGWSGLAWRAPSGEPWSFFAIELLAAALLSLLFHFLGRDLLQRFKELLARDEHQAEVQQRTLTELQLALDRVKTLRGLVPICSSCKKIRDDKGYWHQVEAYVHDHSQASFTHGLCPSCAQELRAEFEVLTRPPRSSTE